MDVFYFLFLRVHRTTDWSDLTETDYCLIFFNLIEAAFWFGCAIFVYRRNARSHRNRIEDFYAFLFLLFGLTDVVETFQVSSPLIWIKLVILIPLFVIRYRVLDTYTPRPKLV